jgi:hypothetical protein
VSAVLRAGDLTATVTDDGRLRPVLAGGRIALDAVYVAVRDPEWNTVPAVVSGLRTGDGEVSFTARHAVGFRWTGRITVIGDTLTYTMDGTAERAFTANRVGFCLLHPIESAGRPLTVRTADGAADGVFPDRIAPHQPFTDISGLSCDVGGARLEIALGGALFEMEDHRNWTDAGFKTYCTPLRLPAPVRYATGRRVHQSVTLRLAGTPRPAPPPTDDVRIGSRRTGRLPRIGFGAGDAPPDPATLALVAAAGPAHLHTELDLGGPWRQRLRSASAEAGALGVPLDAGLVVPPGTDPGPALAALHDAPVGRVFAFDAVTGTTSAALAEAMRTAGVPVAGGGSRANFAEFNRARLPVDRLGVLGYAVTPRVHHDDDRSMLDTLLAQPHTVRDAREVAAGRPVVVGPITLGPRENPQARVRASLPPDARQRGPFAAVWALGSIAAMRDAAALTFFTTTGPGGLVGDRPHPVHAVFAALAGHAGAELLDVDADPRRWAVLAPAGGPVLAGNLRDEAAEARIDGVTHRFGPYEVRVLT